MRVIGTVSLAILVAVALAVGCGGGGGGGSGLPGGGGGAGTTTFTGPDDTGMTEEAPPSPEIPAGDAVTYTLNPESVHERLRVAHAVAEEQRTERTNLLLAYARQLGTLPSGPTRQQEELAKRKRLAAIAWLKRLGDRRAGPYLLIHAGRDPEAQRIALLQDRRPTPVELVRLRDEQEVRLACLDAIGSLQDFTAMPGLIPMLADLDLKVAEATMAALNQIMDDPEMGDDPYAYYDFLGGKDLAARRRTAEKWERWRKWWWRRRVEGMTTPPVPNGEREVPVGPESASPAAESGDAGETGEEGEEEGWGE